MPNLLKSLREPYRGSLLPLPATLFSPLAVLAGSGQFYFQQPSLRLRQRITMQDISRDMGKHEAQLAVLEREVLALRDDVKAIREILDQANGGWKVITWVAGASGAVGALVSWIASKMHFAQ